MNTITMTSMYHYNCVLRSQVTVFDIANIITEYYLELRRGVFAAVFLEAIDHGEYSYHFQHNFAPVIASTITHLIVE